MAEGMIPIEVVHAAVERQLLRMLDVPEGTTVAQAVERSGLLLEFPELGAEPAVGIFGKVVKEPGVHKLEAGDRIEIYRPLLADPMEVRRQRAAKAAKAPKKPRKKQ